MPIKNVQVDPQRSRPSSGIEGGNTFKVIFQPFDVMVQAKEGQTLLEVCEEHQLPLDHQCGGNCACSSCQVLIREGMKALSPIDEDEQDQLDDIEHLRPLSRLGCQARVFGEIEVEILRAV
ncbi:MAG: 2Fe-2S iron-sulfur cluster-binding protein [Nitrospiraceae bacterium]